jgi:hypothetical protein
MSLFKSISRGVRSVGKAVLPVARTVTRSPIARAIPGVGGALALADIGLRGASMLSSMTDASVPNAAPQIPNLPMGLSLPKRGLPVPQRAGISPTPIPATGAGTQLQAPQGMTLPLSSGTSYLRPPRGFVTIYNNLGQPIRFQDRGSAVKLGLWKPAKKPPISVTDWESLRRANKAVRAIKRAGKRAENVANFRMTTTRTRTVCAPKKAC